MKRQLVAFIMIATMTLAIFGSAVVMATPADGCIPRIPPTVTWDEHSFNVHDAYVIKGSDSIITFTELSKGSQLATTASTGMEMKAQQGTNIAYLGVHWQLNTNDWNKLKNRPVTVTARVSYKLVGGGSGDYGSSSSTVLLGASDPIKPTTTMTLRYATAPVSKQHKASALHATGQLRPTTLEKLKTQDGDVTIWVALQTHIVGGIPGHTTASGDVTVQSIQLKWMA